MSIYVAPNHKPTHPPMPATTNPPTKLPTDGGAPLAHPAFANLPDIAAPAGRPRSPSAPPAPQNTPPAPAAPAPPKPRGRVDIIREKSGRAGKTVTIARGFVGIGLSEKETLAKKMRTACGAGGTVNKNGHIEIQGDKRPEVARILTEAGFRPVFAGG